MKLRNYLTLASFLSYLRVILLIPIFIFYDNLALLIILIIAAALTDALDGYTARATNTATEEGAIIDGACDKLFFIPLLLLIYFKANLPPVSLAAFFLRDIVVVLGGVVAGIFMLKYKHMKKFKHDLKARLLGKVTTVFIFITIFWILLEAPHLNVLIYLLLVISALSAMDYFWAFYKEIRRMQKN